MIDNFYDSPGHSEPLRIPDVEPAAADRFDSTKAVDNALEVDNARTAAAIAQLSHSPVAHPSKDPPILPSSPPREYPPQWQPHWTHNRPLAFTSSPIAFTNPPPPTPIAGFSTTAGPTPFAVASHIRPMPSPLQSKAPSPNTTFSKTNSPSVASSKETSPIFSASNTASPTLSMSKTGSPAPTETSTPVLTPAMARTNSNPVFTPVAPRAGIPAIPSPSLQKTVMSSISPSAAIPKPIQKENAPARNKVAKKHATDSPTAAPSPVKPTPTPSAPRSVKKSRCVRCVKQHGACDLDARRPCDRCAKAGLSAAECIPREYKPKKKP